MSDRPNDTLVLTDSPPAHRIARPAQPWMLWAVAALLIVVDTLLIALITIDKSLSPLLVPALLLTGIIGNLGVAFAIMQSLPDRYHRLGFSLFASGMAIGALVAVLIYR